MKENKFRYWCIETKSYEYIDHIFSPGELVLHNSGLYRVDEWSGYSGGGIEAVNVSDRFIVEEFIGLKDKNGNYLDWWENDIGEHPVSKERFVVKYSETRGQWCAVYKDDSWLPLYMQIGEKGLAVKIGNINQNPELLEDK